MGDGVNTLHCEDLNELASVAKIIVKEAKGASVWIFKGEMGAGKTTLIRALCDELSVLDNVSSPTFSIVNEYVTSDDDTIYHFDFYRLEKESEAEDIGVSEYFESGHLCLLEWPMKIVSLLPDDYFVVEILADSQEKRTIHLKHNHGRSV